MEGPLKKEDILKAICSAFLIAGIIIIAAVHAEPTAPAKAVEVAESVAQPNESAKEIVALKAETAELKKQLATLSSQANGLLRKVGNISAEKALLEIEVERLSLELDTARKVK